MNSIALDTNIAIDVLNENLGVIEKLQAYDLIYLPVTVAGELLFGAKNSAKRKNNLNRFRAFIDSCLEIQVDSLIAEEYSDIRLALKKEGRPIPENDIWIAATCKVNGLKLMTRDRHFKYVEGLNLEIIE